MLTTEVANVYIKLFNLFLFQLLTKIKKSLFCFHFLILQTKIHTKKIRKKIELNPAVQAYLDEHLLRSMSQKNTLAGMRGGSLRPRNLRRRMSVKGAIKKTRSINVDCKYIPYRHVHRQHIFSVHRNMINKKIHKNERVQTMN